jgi:nucleoside-diphosphate-sugar epimerase
MAIECTGIIHLAAVSRVLWGQQDPDKCWRVNVDGTKNVVEAAQKGGAKWMIYASSREVYGKPEKLPVSEDTALTPMNIYGRSKMEAESVMDYARTLGINTVTCRFANVYGNAADHHDRVIPAFTRAAANGATIRMEGKENVFDFNHVNDTVAGLGLVVDALNLNEVLPAIHFVSGRGTTLGELAELAIRFGLKNTSIEQHPPRKYDVDRFIGDPSRAEKLLGWKRTMTLEDGIKDMVQQFSQFAVAA